MIAAFIYMKSLIHADSLTRHSGTRAISISRLVAPPVCSQYLSSKLLLQFSRYSNALVIAIISIVTIITIAAAPFSYLTAL